MTASDDRPRPFGITWDGNKLPVGPGPDEVTSFDPRRLDFGQYVGRSIEELARTDPVYVDWLSKHPSGARYRIEIARVLAARSSRTRF
jgi:hypothetical protein